MAAALDWPGRVVLPQQRAWIEIESRSADGSVAGFDGDAARGVERVRQRPLVPGTIGTLALLDPVAQVVVHETVKLDRGRGAGALWAHQNGLVGFDVMGVHPPVPSLAETRAAPRCEFLAQEYHFIGEAPDQELEGVPG